MESSDDKLNDDAVEVFKRTLFNILACESRVVQDATSFLI